MTERLRPLKCLPLHIVLPHKFNNLLLSFTTVPEGRTSTQNTGFLPWNMFYNRAAKEAVVFYALFPKIFALISTFKEKFYRVFVVTLCSGVGKDSGVDSCQYPAYPVALSLQWCILAPRRPSGAHPGRNAVGWM